MPLERLVQALADQWDSVAGLLTAESSGLLRTYLERIVRPEATAEEQLDVLNQVAELLSITLPAEHPARRAIAEEDGPRLNAGRPVRLPDDLVNRLAQTLTRTVADAVASDAVARLLRAPALSAEALRAKGGDPESSRLIRLADSLGPSFPAFQFDSGGRPIDLVLTVNDLLGAESDPWGAADWWLGRNAWLDDRTPAEMIGLGAGDAVLVMARALVEEE